jgi:hypothetical protein
MRAEAARPHILQVARADELNVDGRTAIPQDEFQHPFAALAGNVDDLALIALKGVLYDIGAGFIDGENDFALVVVRATRQLAQLANQSPHDNEEPGLGSNSDFDHVNG